MLERVYNLLESGDSPQAIAAIQQQGEPIEVARSYHGLLRDIYGKKHDVPRMIFIGRAGIRYCLDAAEQADTDDPQLTQRMKGAAKAIAYDLSANAWPGWQDPGVTITRSDSIAALDAARLNLRLGRELDRDGQVLGNAHWLLGAQLLALDRHEEAGRQFAESFEQFTQADKADFSQMARGYVGIAKLAADETDEKLRGPAEEELAAAIAALKKMGGDDALFFAQQLEDVAKVFVKP